MSSIDIQKMCDEILPATIEHCIEQPLEPPITLINCQMNNPLKNIIDITNEIENETKIKQINTTIKLHFQKLHIFINEMNKQNETIFKICNETTDSFQVEYTLLINDLMSEYKNTYCKLKITYKSVVEKITNIYNMLLIKEYFDFVYYKNELSLIENSIELCIYNYNCVKDYSNGIKSYLHINNKLLIHFYE